MASDSETEKSTDASESDDTTRGLWWRAAVAGAGAGTVVGLLDVLISLRAGNELVGGADALRVVLFYAAFFAPCGLIASLFTRRFEWPARATSLLITGGAGLFFIGAVANVMYLPDFTSGLSLAVDLVLVVVAVVWMRWRYHGPGSDEVRVGAWLLVGLVCAVVAFGLRFLPHDAQGPQVHASTKVEKRPNVLIYMVDTLRADALSCYGYDKPTSPEVDAFAAEAVLFEECLAPSSWTKPSVASLFTGLYPSAHACVQQREVLVPDAESLAEVFAAAGWRTAAFSDNPFVSPEFGLGQGFQQFDHVRPSVIANGTLLGKVLFMTRLMSLVGEPLGVGDHADRGAAILRDAGLLPFVREDDDQPWFAYVHTMEPHLPYDPPREDAEAFGLPEGVPYGAPPKYNGVLPFQTAPEPDPTALAHVRAQYDGEVRDMSRQFGATLDALRAEGELDDTIVVFVGDHGEEFHDHGGYTHGHSLHREVVHVPLIVRTPAGDGGRRIRGVSSLLDLFPTLVETCGITYPKGAQVRTGRSLVPQLTGAGGKAPSNAMPTTRTVLGEVTMGPVRLRSVRSGRWLLIRAEDPTRSAESLYDVISDPLETRDRAEAETVRLTELRALLDASFSALDEVALIGKSRDLDAETVERLRSLGYVGGQ